MTSPLTYDEAIQELDNNPQRYTTPQQLRELVERVDVSSPGRVTVLYSGGVANDVNSSSIVKAMLEAGEDIRVIDSSDAARFLNSHSFYRAVADAYDIPVRPLIEGNYRGPAADWLYHPTQGPWADTSARFVDATVGEVRAIVSDARPDRVFGATELPRLLDNPNVTLIEGIPREVLVARQASHGSSAAFDMIAARSYENVGTLRIAMDPEGSLLRGTPGQPTLDSRAYFAQTEVEARMPPAGVQVEPLSSRMNPPNASVLAGRPTIESLELDSLERARTPRIGTAGRALGIAGLALEAYDGAQAVREVRRLRGEGNDTASESELIHFGSRSVGGLGGAAIGAGVGGASTSWSGPGMLVGGGVGGIVGVFGGQKFAEWTDNRSIYNQEDRSGHTWAFDPDNPGGGWQRPAPIDASLDGIDNARRGTLRAPPSLANELDYKATTTSGELILGGPPPQRDPFSQAANEHDTRGSRPANWQHDPENGRWTRRVYGAFVERGMTPYHTETASPERAAQLDRAAAQIVLENAQNSPASIAARYEDAYIARGWAAHGPMPAAVTSARTDIGTLIASDENRYQRQADGRWVSSGLIYDSTARGPLAAELDATRTVLQAHLPPPREIPPPVPMSEDARVRDTVTGAYANAGIGASPERIAAAAAAVEATWATNGLDPGTTALAVQRDAAGRFGLDSPIGSLQLKADGRTYRMVALTGIEEIRAVETARQTAPQDDAMLPRNAARREADASPSIAEPTVRSAALLADHPAHPDHDTFTRIHDWVRGTGQWNEDASRNVASALYREQTAAPLVRRVDQVTGALGRNGEENVFAVYAPFGDKTPFFYASVDGREASLQPAQRSLEQAEQILQQAAQQQQEKDLQQQDQQALRAPQMAI